MERIQEFFQHPEKIAGAVFFLAVALILGAILPRQAHKRGYGFLPWFLLQIAAMNPLYLLIIVGLLPNKTKMRQREQYTAELNAKLTTPALAESRPL